MFGADANQLFHPIRRKLGVPEGQIDAAAGHLGDSTGKRNYRHLRPDYLSELMNAVEDYWSEMTRLTAIHLRSQHDPKSSHSPLRRQPRE